MILLEAGEGLGGAVLTDDDRELGRAVADSIWGSNIWCFRKVESVELLEGQRARRRVSLDCMPPPDRVLSYESAERKRSLRRRMPHGQAMVPLALIAKGAVRDLDTSGPDGLPLPVLTREQNGELSLFALAYQFDREIGEVTVDIHDHLRTIVFGDQIQATEAVKLLLPADGAETGEAEIAGLSGPLIDLMRDLAQNFLLVVLVPQELVGVRTVLKFAFDWTAVPAERNVVKDVFAGAGYMSRTFKLDVGDPSWAASYHLEVRVQSPLVARELRLPPRDDGDAAAIEQGVGTLVHASASYSDAPPTDREAALVLGVGAQSIRLVAILVTIFTAVVFQLEQRLPGAQDALMDAPDGAVAILLSVPAVAVALLAGVGESHLAASVLRPLRFITMSCAALLALASASLVGQLHEPWISTLWRVGAWSTTVVALGLLLPLLGVVVRRWWGVLKGWGRAIKG